MPNRYDAERYDTKVPVCGLALFVLPLMVTFCTALELNIRWPTPRFREE